jgi:hypothetical protein
VTLAGFELGNEINSPMFNSDFSMPAENPAHSREFNVADLAHDPEAQQVARGYLQYLKLLAVIKDVRSRSRLNQQAVIVSAGLVFNKAPAAPRTARLDAVSATATLDFMRANGLDDLADVYGVHTYPSTDKPGNPATAAGRRERLQKYVLAECRPQGSRPGKPCWITEWGVPNHDASCPPNETRQLTLVDGMRTDFRTYRREAPPRPVLTCVARQPRWRLLHLSVRSLEGDRAASARAVLIRRDGLRGRAVAHEAT